ncbi:SCP-like extracellular [Caldicellulosiruptor owensensis OL]|uniref:SCP-like extracellular n=1 Tax=Caldicellulosiruptor owensensis (strain ATCC 700167 / DSM 13100 / OL) TaxID=632518 RepID=E4Q196_CALOW|nr:SCP-like extracellular [Caldicellulosiruptor owensensis OL]
MAKMRFYFLQLAHLLICVTFIVNIVFLCDSSYIFGANMSNKKIYMFCTKSYFDNLFPNVKKSNLKSPFNFPFYVSENPSDFFIAGFEKDKLVFFYTNSKRINLVSGIKIGSAADAVKKSGLSFINKFVIINGNTITTYFDGGLKTLYDVSVINNSYYFFIIYDRIVKPNVVCGIFMVKKSLWDEVLLKEHFLTFDKSSEQDILSSFEKLMFMHLNSMRAYLQKPYFSFSNDIAKIAKTHSQNMARYNFFSHTDNSGKTISDRFLSAGILYKKIGENIAMGTKLLPFFANHLLFNSEGHRKNIEDSFEVVGIGCAIEKNFDNVYYTQDFAVLRQ